MNDRPFAHSRSFHLLKKTRHGLLLLLACLLLVACGGDEEPTSTPASPPAVEAPVSVLPTAEPTAVAIIEPTATSVPPTPEAVAALAPTPAVTATTATTPTATTPTVPATPASAPLEAGEGQDCEIEPTLDLVGYPNLIQTMGCPIEAAIFDSIAINEFGAAQPSDRFMLWFSHELNIYVLLPDGTYQVHEDTWVEDVDPTFPCNPPGGEEDSPPLPRRGFAKIWCSDPELQEILGLVPREERLCQHSVLQRFETGRLLACFEDATIRYFRILDNDTWDVQIQ